MLGKDLFLRNIYDYRMYLDLKDPGISRSLLLFGERELDHKVILEKVLRPGMTVLDIGANIGYYALMELQLIGKSGKLIAVEPSPSNVKLLKANLNLNGFSDVDIINGAVSDSSSEKEFYLSKQSNLNTFHNTGSAKGSLSGESITVKTYTVPQIIENNGLDLIRMDVEGHEVEVINGMLEAIRQNKMRPMIIFETHLTRYSKTHDMESVLRALFEAGYRTQYLASSYERGTSLIEEYGYTGIMRIQTDGVTRAIFEHIKDEDLINFVCNVGGARTVLLMPEEYEMS